MKKVCFFTNSMFKIWGEQRITSIISNELERNGYEVTIIIKNKEEIDYELYNLSKSIKLIMMNYNYNFRLNNYKIFDYLRKINRKFGLFKNNKKLIRQFYCSDKMLNKLKNIFSTHKYDYIIWVAGDRSFILSYLKEYIDGNIIFWNHMNFDTHFKNKNSRYCNEEFFIKELLINFDKIIVLNQDDKIKFKKYFNVNSIVIENCKSFVSDEKTHLNNKRLMACGRLVPQKGFELLIDIIKLFSKYKKEYKLDIYGEGPLKKTLIKKIKDNNLEDYICIQNPEKDIKQIFLKHDIFLNTSIYEGFGLVTLEALECGLPVIGFDIPANKSLIKDSLNGILIKSFDIEEFSIKLCNLINNPLKMQKIQKNIPVIIDKYNKEKIIEKWTKILK